jgi:hypothetical protein
MAVVLGERSTTGIIVEVLHVTAGFLIAGMVDASVQR